MVDARLPERWVNDRRLQRLPADAFRAYVNALLWAVANRTDGRLVPEDLPLVPHFDGHAAALVEAGLWTRQADGWLVADFEATQTSAHDLEVLDNVRRREREKKARQRAEKAEKGDSPPGRSPGTVPRDDTGRQDRQARQAGTTGPDPEPKSSVSRVEDLASSFYDREDGAWSLPARSG